MEFVVSHQTLRVYRYDLVVRKPFVEQIVGLFTELEVKKEEVRQRRGGRGVWKGCYKKRGVNRRNANRN